MSPDNTAPDTRYPAASTLLENTPYALMILLGVVALLLSLYPGGAMWGVEGLRQTRLFQKPLDKGSTIC